MFTPTIQAGQKDAKGRTAQRIAAVSADTNRTEETLKTLQTGLEASTKLAQQAPPLSSELQTIVQAWPKIPEHIRAAIMALAGPVKP